MVKSLKPYKKYIRYLSIAIAGVVIFFAGLFLLVYLGVFGHLSSVEELQSIQNHESSEVFSSDKVLLGKYYLQDRTNVRYQDLPEHLIDALLAIRGRTFL